MLDELQAKERYNNLLREAEHDRLVAEIRAQQPGFYAHLMVRFANLLVRAGSRIQARYRLRYEEVVLASEYGRQQCQDC
jgi:hypothetical protein